MYDKRKSRQSVEEGTISRCDASCLICGIVMKLICMNFVLYEKRSKVAHVRSAR